MRQKVFCDPSTQLVPNVNTQKVKIIASFACLLYVEDVYEKHFKLRLKKALVRKICCYKHMIQMFENVSIS